MPYSTPIFGFTVPDADTYLDSLGTEVGATVTRLEQVLADRTPVPGLGDLNAVIGRINRGWQLLTNQPATYNQPPAGSWATLLGMSATVSVPSGQTLEVRWEVPYVSRSANSDVWARLLLNGAVAGPGGGARFGGSATDAGPLRLYGSYRNTTGAAVDIVLAGQALLLAGTATFEGAGLAGPGISARLL